MAIGKLYFSHSEFNFSNLDSEWLTKKNLNKIITSEEVNDYHSTMEDCGQLIGEIDQKLLCHCQSIECLDLSWDVVINLDNHERYMQLAGLLRSKYKDNSTGWEDLHKESLTHVTYKRATKQSNKQPLWVAGCSWSSASGVNSEERWGHLVAEKLGLEEINLAKTGGSIWDASDQILRADIQKGDIVVWGLTSLGRVDVVYKNQLTSFPIMGLNEVANAAREYYTLDYFWSNTQCILAMRQIHQVVNYCKKIGARLYLINFLDETWSPFILDGEENYLHLRCEFNDDTLLYKMIDYGTDGRHPGPLQHKEYAKEIIKFIQGT